MRAPYLLGLAISALAAANPIAKRPPRTLEETWSAQHVKISIALQPECRQLLEQTLHRLSSPSSPQHGRHLGREEAKALLRPRQASADAVKGWLSRAGVPAGDVLSDGQFLHVRAVTQQAGALLGTRCNGTRGSQTIAVSSLPEEAQGHVVTIQCAQIQGRRNTSSVDNSSPSFVGSKPKAAQYDELNRFLRTFAPSSANATFSVESVSGGENPQGTNVPASEANMDIQYAVAMAHDAPVRFYATGGENHDLIPDLDMVDKENEYLEPYLEFASHLLNLDDDQLPKVVSISYGANEQLFPKPYAQQVCDMFGQLGTRGVSVVVASGDQGPGISCRSNDGTERPKLMPSFPATCPYVTSVGATRGIGPEVAADFSSGGFSDYFARPEWQDEAVGNYLRLHGDEWKGYYSLDGRGFPDVAAQGANYRFLNHGKDDVTSGTSFSSPVFAALIALLNDHRSKSGLPPLGFLNPWIYGIGNHAFTDITESRSAGCVGYSRSGLPSPVIPNAGWSAVPGWDPVTGWGTPLFDRLMNFSCT
ncbi:tripeptidyl-peptidase 1 precursor [Trichoderma cornu-damae]|uniref:tripeptidyl-peptidase II n=1 Tax=Trichoderma cornu-damae TaxID=654480 RepID=A0A9P8TTZ5_9HYPO|nr:tripeptidyl-peptidase 1 precursor [Trichoderma cornu-damae]